MLNRYGRWHLWLSTLMIIMVSLASASLYRPAVAGHVTEDNFDKIQVGMSYEEAGAILGAHHVTCEYGEAWYSCAEYREEHGRPPVVRAGVAL